MAIGGATGLTGIFGDPVAHSASPAMHNAAYAALGMDRAYVPFHVLPSHLPAALHAIAALGLMGVNVTVPHKERVARLLKRQSAEARLLGAVNCIWPKGGELFGDNTDARGLESDLAALGAPVKGRTVILIGAGGGAAAALLAVRRLGAGRVVLANRTRSRAVKLAARFGKLKIEISDLTGLQRPELIGDARPGDQLDFGGTEVRTVPCYWRMNPRPPTASFTISFMPPRLPHFCNRHSSAGSAPPTAPGCCCARERWRLNYSTASSRRSR